MSLRKIGLHIIGSYADKLGAPRVVKLLDPSPEYICQVRGEVGPDCTIVVRWYEREQPLDSPILNARDWMARHQAQMVDAEALYEGYNEIADSAAPAFAAFEVERLRLMHAAGKRCAVGSWSVGVPNIRVWPSYRIVLNAMGPRDAIALHEYWSDTNDLQNIWHVGRWRLEPLLSAKPIVVTECGRDIVEAKGYRGWHADPNLTASGYLAELDAYGAMLDTQSNVLGATVFTAGQIVDPQWQPFEVNSIAAQIIAGYSGATPAQPEQPSAPAAKPAVILPIVNTGKAWYTADAYYGPYDGHPARARDWNLESMGNSDLGEPLQAPCDGWVVYAQNAGGGHGLVVSFVAVVDGEIVNWHWKHLQRADVKAWQQVKQGQRIGAIGNAYGQYSAHLHEEVCIGAITGPTQDWRDPAFEYVDPAEWYIAHGVDAALVDRMTGYDGR